MIQIKKKSVKFGMRSQFLTSNVSTIYLYSSYWPYNLISLLSYTELSLLKFAFYIGSDCCVC